MSTKITVLVKYKEWVDLNNAHFDGYFQEKGKVVEVENLTELNDMFSNIVDVKILKIITFRV